MTELNTSIKTPKRPIQFHVLAKPTGAVCNLACKYSFFLLKDVLYPGSSFRMTHEVLEAYVRQTIESQQTGEVNIAWQQDGTKGHLPLWQREEVQEMLRSGAI